MSSKREKIELRAARKREVSAVVDALTEKYNVAPGVVARILLDSGVKFDNLPDWKDLDAIVQEALAEGDMTKKSYNQIAEEQHYGMPQGFMPDGLYKTTYGNTASWKGNKAFDLDAGEDIPKDVVDFSQRLGPIRED